MTMTQLLLMLAAVAIFGAALTALAAFVAQLVVLNLTGRRFRPLRWATLTVPGLMLCCAGLTESVIRLGAAGALFLGWALAWAVYRLVCGGDRREKTGPC